MNRGGLLGLVEAGAPLSDILVRVFVHHSPHLNGTHM